MANPALFGLKILGFAAAGMALAVGWKLGCHLVDLAMGETRPSPWFVNPCADEPSKEEPLWKRRFSKVSE